jgi:Putative zinc-finger
MTSHIGEDVALYALGLLNEREQQVVDAHVASCEACGQLLAQAYDDVAAMAETQPQLTMPARQHRARRAIRWHPAFVAIAAAIVLALLPSSYFYEQNRAMHQTMVANADALARIASTPHRMAPFSGTTANVMYAKDGSWYCVVVRGAKKPMDVAWMHDGRQTMLGTAVPHGNVAVLYLPRSHRMDQLALLADDRMVGQARLVF